MAKFKKGLILLSVMGATVALTACNDNKDTTKDNNTTHATESKSTKSDNSTSKEKSESVSENELSEKTKLALAFFADDVDQYILTKDEALTGVFENKTGGETKNKQLYKLLLIKEQGVANAPKDMNFYTVHPPKGSFASIIGVSKDKIFVGGTQGALDYKEMSDTGNEYSIKDLYNKNKGYTSLSELAKKIEITDKNPMLDDKTREEFEANENPNTNTHLRTQVYQMIEELDGEPIDTDKYLVDNVQMTKGGKWYVNYRNKNAEIVGTYTTKDGKVIKKDSDGNILKSKVVEQRN
ncbi:hypothetical protein [Staphylococcus succinus]|uniref:hypothetical protein n=1 Tax=Staphylococcus succinus TaxID=61015 RepID=UPI000E69B6CB|nr:hypothetical protein [Staphylococcus succinus]RIN27722.1 hypothetical protein BU067_01565 [Staphylococcus succinus]